MCMSDIYIWWSVMMHAVMPQQQFNFLIQMVQDDPPRWLHQTNLCQPTWANQLEPTNLSQRT